MYHNGNEKDQLYKQIQDHFGAHPDVFNFNNRECKIPRRLSLGQRFIF